MAVWMAAALLQAAMGGPCVEALCDADRLSPVFQMLAETRQTRRPVRILQIGDSHTAADQVTGSWRTLLQSRYGSAGRGVLPPGRPYAGYLTRGITASQSPGWSVNGIFGAAYDSASSVPIGLSGYSLSTSVAGASIGLKADSVEWFDRFTVCAMTGPGAGAVALSAGAINVRWSLDAPRVEPSCRTIETGSLTDTALLTVVQGPVTVTSWSTEASGRGGVLLSNLGTVGAQFIHFGRTTDAVVTRELAEYRPDLIVIAFGTNEAFRPKFSAGEYDAALQASIRRVQRLAPGVPMLLIGAPDSSTKLPALQSGESGVSAGCDGEPWRPTAALATVQSIQRRRAHQLGLAYWDWSSRMGGRCTANDWSRRDPPMMRPDHVHFSTMGAAEIARRLQQDLDGAMVTLGGTGVTVSAAPGDARR
ncbi:GDSL-type esterase/lipase family protein [Flavisphingomonas formosensis]|uniref:GDSL-type esterase/lipase family protein n=1 Tax=Flavisphingomonas formosensis TaxID=861534 RepID=UPI0018DF58B3|nr:GDSL-type esterase/lipase family protein [Sphingomonas formosensis]